MDRSDAKVKGIVMAECMTLDEYNTTKSMYNAATVTAKTEIRFIGAQSTS